ncbi:MAG TPA: hypothetical protein VD789_03005, partial [Thermomicrobiales bacterium]|nr:hypothetical protein [Thermomicrobiales bacterium]
MIIESGSDLHLLIDEQRLERWELQMIALDADLRLLWVKTIAHDFRGRFDGPTVLAAEKRLKNPAVAYVAFGHRVPDVAHYQHHHLRPEDLRVLDRFLARRKLTSLGVIICDGEKWASTGPLHTFEHYTDGEDLPRTLVIPPP